MGIEAQDDQGAATNDEATAEMTTWLREHYPNANDPFAYWDA